MVSPAHYIWLAVILFVIGAVGVLVRRNALVIFMCVELMLNAANVAFVACARMHEPVQGTVYALFVIAIPVLLINLWRRDLRSFLRASERQYDNK